MEKEEALLQSILLKKPYLNGLNLIQLELIKDYHKTTSLRLKEEIASQISSTIVGIAQGIRNTG